MEWTPIGWIALCVVARRCKMASHVDTCDYERMSDASWWAASPSSAWHPRDGAPAPEGVGACGAYALALERDPLAVELGSIAVRVERRGSSGERARAARG